MYVKYMEKVFINVFEYLLILVNSCSDSTMSASRNHTVVLRVFSEDGEKIDSLSAMSMREGSHNCPTFL